MLLNRSSDAHCALQFLLLWGKVVSELLLQVIHDSSVSAGY